MAIQVKNSPSIHGYTFEAIDKGQYTKKVIDHFDHLVKIPTGYFGSSTFHIGAYDYTVQLNQWKITDVVNTIDQIKKDNTNLLNNYSIKILGETVKSITVTVCETEFLPFNYIILHFELDADNLGLDKSYRQISGLLNSLIEYWLTFNGKFSSEYKATFSTPAFYQIHYNSEKIRTELDKIVNNLKKYSEENNIKKYVESCNELKKYFLFENMDKDPISILKIQDNYYILGNFFESHSDFANVFSLDPLTFKYTGTNPFLVSNSFFGVFPALFFPYLLLVSPIFWLRINRRKITEYLSQLNQLKIEYKTEDYLNSDNNKEFSQIFDLDNSLNFLLSESKDLQTVNRIFNNHFLDNPEIIDKSVILEKYDIKKEKEFEIRMKHSYVNLCNLTFQKGFHEIEKYAKEIQEDLSFIKKRVELLQNKQSEKTKSKQNKIIIISAIVSSIFAGIVGLDVLSRWFHK